MKRLASQYRRAKVATKSIALKSCSNGTCLRCSNCMTNIAFLQYIVIMQYIKMPTQLIARAKEIRDDGSVVEIVVWRLPQPLLPCLHLYKYRLYFGAGGMCRVRYDNERGKGDHRHVNEVEEPYLFKSIAQLLDDFEHDVQIWK